MANAPDPSRLIRFALRPIDEIEPWGRPGTLSMSWFALTDGHYLLGHGSSEIYRYSAEALSALGWTFSPAPVGFEYSADYQVARLFHDLTEILPRVLEEVPPDVAALLESAETQSSWEQATLDLEGPSTIADSDALRWVSDRTLSGAHLRAGPSITFWRTGTGLHIRCDNRSRQIDGVPIWRSERMEATVPLPWFLAEVRHFGEQFLAQMDERVRLVEAGWEREGVALNAEDLRRAQAENMGLWSESLGRVAGAAGGVRATDWAVVRGVMER